MNEEAASGGWDHPRQHDQEDLLLSDLHSTPGEVQTERRMGVSHSEPALQTERLIYTEEAGFLKLVIPATCRGSRPPLD